MTAPARSDNALLLDTLVYAFRYALGRSSYAPSDVMHALRAHAGELDERSRVVIVREITGALLWDDPPLPYADEWRRTRDMLAGRMVSP